MKSAGNESRVWGNMFLVPNNKETLVSNTCKCWNSSVCISTTLHIIGTEIRIPAGSDFILFKHLPTGTGDHLASSG
jgi:hypothetical protein